MFRSIKLFKRATFTEVNCQGINAMRKTIFDLTCISSNEDKKPSAHSFCNSES